MAETSADVGSGRDLRPPLPRVLGSASGHRELEPWQREISRQRRVRGEVVKSFVRGVAGS